MTTAGFEAFEEIAQQQGWNDTSRVQLLTNFISERGMIEQFTQFAKDAADDENQSADWWPDSLAEEE